MRKISPQIQNGPGRLVLSENFLIDLSILSYLDIPTIQGTAYRIQFKFSEQASAAPEIQVTKLNEGIVEFLCNLNGPSGSVVGTKNWVDLTIAGQVYKFLFAVTKIQNSCARVELALYEV